MNAAEYERQLARFLNDFGPAPRQTAECLECGGQWVMIPSGFVYDDPAAGWRQDPYAQYVSGYCKSCADAIESGRSRYGDRSHEDWLIECERQEG